MSLSARGAASAMQGRRRTTLAADPVNTVPPVIAWTVSIGSSPAITPGTWTGSPTLRYTLYRDGSPVSGAEDLTEAAAESYAAVSADIGPDLLWREIDSTGSDTADSNTVAYYPAQEWRHVHDAAAGVTLSGADVDTWADQGTGGDLLAAAASGNRPLFVASDASFAGEPSVTFDGGTEWLRDLTPSWGASLSNLMVFLAARVDSFASADVLWWYGSNSNNVRMRVTTGNRHDVLTAGDAGSAVSTGTTSIATGAHLIGITTRMGTDQAAYYEGTAEDTDANAGTSLSDALDSHSLAGTRVGGATAAFATPMLCSDPTVTSTKIANLAAYCAWRFGT